MKDENVPKWFHEYAVRHEEAHAKFMKENAEQHGELANKIEQAKGDLRDSLTWRIIGAGLAVLTLNIGFMTLVLPRLLD